MQVFKNNPSYKSENMIERPAISVVAPCFNEAEGLGEFYRRVSEACRASFGDNWELVLINDGSKDQTWNVMQGLVTEDPHVIAINLSRNFGHQLALSAGLEYCAGAHVLIIDADLQDPPELLADMLKLMESEGADVVYGQRHRREGESFVKKATASLFYRILRQMVSHDIPVDAGDFRLMTRRALEALNGMPEQHRFIRGLVSWIGFRQVPLKYDREARFAGETGYPFSKMVKFALDAVTSFSTAPLRFASGFGIAFGILGICMMIYTVGSWMFFSTVSGWTSLSTIVLLMGSVQLFVVGIIGEYLGRLYLESKRRPLYIIDGIIRQDIRMATQNTKLELDK